MTLIIATATTIIADDICSLDAAVFSARKLQPYCEGVAFAVSGNHFAGVEMMHATDGGTKKAEGDSSWNNTTVLVGRPTGVCLLEYPREAPTATVRPSPLMSRDRVICGALREQFLVAEQAAVVQRLYDRQAWWLIQEVLRRTVHPELQLWCWAPGEGFTLIADSDTMWVSPAAISVLHHRARTGPMLAG